MEQVVQIIVICTNVPVIIVCEDRAPRRNQLGDHMPIQLYRSLFAVVTSERVATVPVGQHLESHRDLESLK